MTVTSCVAESIDALLTCRMTTLPYAVEGLDATPIKLMHPDAHDHSQAANLRRLTAAGIHKSKYWEPSLRGQP